MNAIEIQQLCKRRRYLSVKEGAEIAGVCTKFIYDRIGTKAGPPYRKRGRVYRLPTYEFIQWSEQPETV
jgi:predicted DNA-binding transcriptional regulator AlpA